MMGFIWNYVGELYLEQRATQLGSPHARIGLETPMDSQKQQSAECAVCGNAAFDLLDGLYFCSDCGTQSQVQQMTFFFALQ